MNYLLNVVKILIATIMHNWVILKAELDLELLIPLTCLTEMFNSFRISSKCVKSYEINCGPRSQMMSSGRPWCLNASCNTRLAVSSLVNAFMHGRKCASLVKRSTTVRMASTPLEGERSVMKSKDIDFHGPSGIANGCNKPYGRCRGTFDRKHTSYEGFRISMFPCSYILIDQFLLTYEGSPFSSGGRRSGVTDMAFPLFACC